MRYKLLSLTLAGGLVFLSLAGRAENLPPLKSVQINLPDTDQTYPPGPGSELADNNCRACHSVEMVLYQPAMTKAGWEAEVNKMRNVYKAPVDAADVAPIVEYLTRIKGAK